MSSPPQERGLEQLSGFKTEWETMWKQRHEVMNTLTRADFFLTLGNFFDDVFTQSEMFADGRNILGPEKAADVLAAVNTANFNNFDAMKDTAGYKGVLWVARCKQEFKRAIILKHLNDGNTLGLSEEEQIVVRGFLEMASVLDDISEKWRDDVVWSETGRQMNALSNEEKVKLPETLAGLKLAHSYAILKAGEGADFEKLKQGQEGHGYYEVLQTEAYSQEYSQLSGIMARMVEELEALSPSDAQAKYMEYFQAWKTLADCRDIEQADKFGEALDRAWMKLPVTHVLVTHPMEYGYYGEEGIRKDVGARMDLMDPTQDDLIAACNDQKEAVLAYLDSHSQGKDLPVLKAKLASLRQTRFVALANITFSMLYDFMAAGESLPNSDHQVVTDELGKRVLVFLEGCKNALERRKKEWKKAFAGTAGTAAENALDDLTVEDWIIYTLAPHEAGETVSRDADTDARMGHRLVANINEIKADVAGLARFGELGRDAEDLAIKLAKLELASAIYRLSDWGNPQADPYHKDGLITTNLAIEAGLLREDSGRWFPDWGRAHDFVAALTQHFWERQVPVWESPNPEEARKRKAELVDSYLEITPEGGVDAILKLVSSRYQETH